MFDLDYILDSIKEINGLDQWGQKYEFLLHYFTEFVKDKKISLEEVRLSKNEKDALYGKSMYIKGRPRMLFVNSLGLDYYKKITLEWDKNNIRSNIIGIAGYLQSISLIEEMYFKQQLFNIDFLVLGNFEIKNFETKTFRDIIKLYDYVILLNSDKFRDHEVSFITQRNGQRFFFIEQNIDNFNSNVGIMGGKFLERLGNVLEETNAILQEIKSQRVEKHIDFIKYILLQNVSNKKEKEKLDLFIKNSIKKYNLRVKKEDYASLVVLNKLSVQFTTLINSVGKVDNKKVEYKTSYNAGILNLLNGLNVAKLDGAGVDIFYAEDKSFSFLKDDLVDKTNFLQKIIEKIFIEY